MGSSLKSKQKKQVAKEKAKPRKVAPKKVK